MRTKNIVNYLIKTDQKNKIVFVEAWGQLKVEEGKRIVTEARTAALKHKFNIIYDVQKLELASTLFDLYYLPREHEILLKPESRQTKVAIVVSSLNSQQSTYEFYADVAHNLGFRVAIFPHREEARAWLIEAK